MKLLIVTQKVDRDDPVLGFFHGWIEAFAAKCEHVTVIALQVGSHNLPANVSVESLGKEQGAGKFSQVRRFLSLQRKLKGQYDVALVHMTPVWVVLGWLKWSAPVYLWYEAKGGGMMLRLALKKVRAVFSASKTGLPLRSSKHVVTGHGIDVTRFTFGAEERDHHLLLTVGRITASKRLDVILRAVAAGDKALKLRIVGGTITEADKALLGDLQKDIQRLGLGGRIEMGPLANDRIVPLLSKATLFLHASHTGLDKAVLEAMACGCLVVSSGRSFTDILPDNCRATDDDMAEVMKRLLSLPMAEQDQLRKELRAIVERDHSLQKLIEKLLQNMQTHAQA